jgi:hypothetical protein
MAGAVGIGFENGFLLRRCFNDVASPCCEHDRRGGAFRVKGEYGRTITDFRVAIRRNPKIADDIHGFALQELAT